MNSVISIVMMGCRCTVVIASQNGLNILDKLTADIVG